MTQRYENINVINSENAIEFSKNQNHCTNLKLLHDNVTHHKRFLYEDESFEYCINYN